MAWLRRLLHAERFWIIISAVLIAWIIIAVGANAFMTATHNPAGFLSLFSPIGLAGFVNLLTPGFLPGLLLIGALTMRNVTRHNRRQAWSAAHENNRGQIVHKEDHPTDR